MEEQALEEVYVLCPVSNGGYQHIDTIPLSALKGVVPNLGDRITLDLCNNDESDGLAIEEVVGRHFVRYINESNGDEAYAWFIVVQTVELDHTSKLAKAIGAVFRNELRPIAPPTKTLPAVYDPVSPPNLPKSKRISHKIKDPAFWTPERKEEMRKKREARLERMKRMGIAAPD
ncbi:hypothetical protein MUO32_22345 [Shinella sp. CPCC 101442]|uniref:hypothetical protein n=1 Tax=Shinella sp. CPCC 101442 TaxID=2932265 RepID=UPI00215308FE|nr:hypothetical protein [Shinella sp. CPCC 101442]MCR6501783.1 hypothetical protein [Shinella sp. CPCC 101442]